MKLRFEGVAFDLDHTLLVDNRLERVALIDLIVRIDAGVAPLHVSLERAGTIADEELARYRSEGVDLETVLRRYVERCGGEGGEGWAPWFRQRCLDLVPRLVVPMPAARRLLSALAQSDLRVAALSNGAAGLQERKAAQIGFFYPVLASERIGLRKPERGAFDHLAARMGLQAERILYVGDDPYTDIAGALGAGFAALWLDGGSKPYPADLAAPTATIRSLDELLPLLIDETV